MAEQATSGLAGLLRQLRAEAQLTQQELAKAAGVSPRAVARSPVVVIRPHEWALPFVPSHAAAVAAMMAEIVNTPGLIGQLA